MLALVSRAKEYAEVFMTRRGKRSKATTSLESSNEHMRAFFIVRIPEAGSELYNNNDKCSSLPCKFSIVLCDIVSIKCLTRPLIANHTQPVPLDFPLSAQTYFENTSQTKMLKIADILSDLTSLRVGVCCQGQLQVNKQAG
jgi:hypothetical protein